MVRRVSEALIACHSARDVEPFLKMTAIAHHENFPFFRRIQNPDGMQWEAFFFPEKKKKLLDVTNSTGQVVMPKSAAKWVI